MIFVVLAIGRLPVRRALGQHLAGRRVDDDVGVGVHRRRGRPGRPRRDEQCQGGEDREPAEHAGILAPPSRLSEINVIRGTGCDVAQSVDVPHHRTEHPVIAAATLTPERTALLMIGEAA